MFWTRLLSWSAGHWLPLAGLGLLLAAFGSGYGLSYKRTTAAWEARWAAAESKAREATARVVAAQNDRLVRSNAALKESQDAIQARDDAIGRLAGELRKYAARPRDLPPPADYAKCVRELAGERDRAEALGKLFIRGSELSKALAAERDDAVARLWAASDAWPR